MKPGGKRRFAAKTANLFKSPNEGRLCEVPRQVVITSKPKRQPVNAIDICLVQLTLGGGIASNHPRDELDIVHRAPRLVGNQLHCQFSDNRYSKRVEALSPLEIKEHAI